MSESVPPSGESSTDPTPPTHRITFAGTAGELFPIFAVNLLLSIITLTIYRFWARTRVRLYLWSRSTLLEEPFEYAGRGGELFIGFLIVLFVVLVPLGLIYSWLDVFLGENLPGQRWLLDFVYYPALLFLIGVGLYRARRYRLSRTLWRGVRFAQTGRSAEYGLRYLVLWFANVLLLGWLTPVKNVSLWDYEMNNTYFGSQRFAFRGAAAPLYKSFAIAWFLYIPTLSCSMAWYKAAEFKLLAAGSRFDRARFAFEIPPRELLLFSLANLLLMIFTLGLALPFVQLRTFRLTAAHLVMHGTPDLDRIIQSTAELPGVGEGLAEAFDFGTV